MYLGVDFFRMDGLVDILKLVIQLRNGVFSMTKLLKLNKSINVYIIKDKKNFKLLKIYAYLIDLQK